MPDSVTPVGERRGLEPSVLTFIRDLHNDFVEAYQREHELDARAMAKLEKILAENLENEIKALRDFYDTILAERDKQYSESFKNAQLAVKDALLSSDKQVNAAFQAAKEAITKSELAQKESNAATFVSITSLQVSLSGLMPKEEAKDRFDNQEKVLTDLRDRLNLSQGKSGGMTTLAAGSAAGISLVVAIISLVLH